MFINGFQDTASDVAMEALRATVVFVDMIIDKNEVQQLQIVINPLIALITSALQNGNEDLVRSAFEVLDAFMQSDKPIINDSIETIVTMCVNVLDARDVDPSIHTGAFQTLITAFECRPKLIAKKNMVAPIITAMVNIIARSDESINSLYQNRIDRYKKKCSRIEITFPEINVTLYQLFMRFRYVLCRHSWMLVCPRPYALFQ